MLCGIAAGINGMFILLAFPVSDGAIRRGVRQPAITLTADGHASLLDAPPRVRQVQPAAPSLSGPWRLKTYCSPILGPVAPLLPGTPAADDILFTDLASGDAAAAPDGVSGPR
jgi:hypothetical protein